MHSTMTRARARTNPAPDDAELISWPADGKRRTVLAAMGIPRVLLVAVGVPAPVVDDALEDWVREPADQVEVATRIATLRQRVAARADRPTVEDDRVLWGDRWVAVPRSQLPVVELLLDRMGAVVSTDELGASYGAGRATTSPAAIKAMIRRLRRSLGEIGLVVTNVRDRGYLLACVDSAASGGSDPTGSRFPVCSRCSRPGSEVETFS
jgi:biotin operon repressor